MVRHGLFVLGVALVAVSAGAWAAEEGTEATRALPADTMARLEAGELVVTKKGEKNAEGNTSGEGVVTGLIEAPADTVLDYLIRFETYPEFMPHVTALESTQDAEGVYHLAFTLKVVWKTVRYHVLQYRVGTERKFAWKLDTSKENDIRDTTGTWVLLEHGDKRTVVVYSLNTDTGMSVPKFIEDFLMNRDLGGVVRALKKRVESNGTYHK
ncbi:MAG TPA: SRPBCC family protein [Candidatus Hydrogenedentes bacterium]|nr:SRPBCC family protein [Candidatus Hydrogenedentota bacterium]HPG69795.1 SRPBCC family protein [Candidatus Hydrogenedentota bacterium]